MDTTDSEYVYAYSGSCDNLPVASSSSYAPLTNTYFNRTQASNESSNSIHFSQSSWRSKIYQDSINMNERNMHFPVKIHPIIRWDTDRQTYIFSNPDEWPVLPNNAKVVGFIGTKKSGRTTAIHSILFELGYYLTEEQLAKSLLPVGVMMYVLAKYNLIFLDCCDIADSATANAGNLVS